MRALVIAACLSAGIHNAFADAADLSTLTGENFGVPEAEAWRQDRRSSDIVDHILAAAPLGDLSAAIREFDVFCESKRLGMNLGREKGDVIEATLRRALASLEGESRRPLVVLELGAHLGDGTLRAAKALAEHPAASGARHTLVSVESREDWASGCGAVVAHGLGGTDAARHVSLLARGDSAPVAAAHAALKALGVPSYDVVMLDHEHHRYEADLRELLRVGSISRGGLVHADNAGRDARGTLREYLRYVQGGGPFITEFTDIHKPYPDKVAVSEYIGPDEL